jgi:hypothetical protein
VEEGTCAAQVRSLVIGRRDDHPIEGSYNLRVGRYLTSATVTLDRAQQTRPPKGRREQCAAATGIFDRTLELPLGQRGGVSGAACVVEIDGQVEDRSRERLELIARDG